MSSKAKRGSKTKDDSKEKEKKSKGAESKTDEPKSTKPTNTESKMDPEPEYMASWYKGTSKLNGKVAIVTGGDSGIGRAVAILFAREGAKIVIVYHDQDGDAKETQKICEKEGAEVRIMAGDLKEKSFCENIVKFTKKEFNTDKIDVLVNNAGTQTVQEKMEDISEEQLDNTFRTNFYSMFYLTQCCVPYMPSGSSIINTSSVTSYKGHEKLVDYSATKGAITTFTRSLASQFAPRGIRVNAVAPGPIWTPLITASFPPDKIAKFGKNVPLKRPGQPEELSPAYVYLASRDSSYVTGQVLHINGGGFLS